MKAVSGKLNVAVPADAAIDSEVDLGPTRHGYGIAVRMKISLPGLDPTTEEEADAAAQAWGVTRPSRSASG